MARLQRQLQQEFQQRASRRNTTWWRSFKSWLGYRPKVRLLASRPTWWIPLSSSSKQPVNVLQPVPSAQKPQALLSWLAGAEAAPERYTARLDNLGEEELLALKRKLERHLAVLGN